MIRGNLDWRKIDFVRDKSFQKKLNLRTNISKKEYLKEFDVVKNGKINEQNWAQSNIAKFHKSVKYSTYQCTICKEAWPLKSKPRSPDSYVCLRCNRDKQSALTSQTKYSILVYPCFLDLQ